MEGFFIPVLANLTLDKCFFVIIDNLFNLSVCLSTYRSKLISPFYVSICGSKYFHSINQSINQYIYVIYLTSPLPIPTLHIGTDPNRDLYIYSFTYLSLSHYQFAESKICNMCTIVKKKKKKKKKKTSGTGMDTVTVSAQCFNHNSLLPVLC